MVPAKVRVDCGYPSVTEEQCNNRGCCFDSSIRNVPWCFKPLQETVTAGKAREQGPLGPLPAPPRLSATWIRRVKRLPTETRPEKGAFPDPGFEMTQGKQLSEGLEDGEVRWGCTVPRHSRRKVVTSTVLLFSRTHPEAFCPSVVCP
ncbi:trefoil factor 3 intestinal [Cricetulus griseus]